MKAQYAANCEFIRENFEGREAIYIEHGAARVRVTNIRVNAEELYLEAQVEVIPTPGLSYRIPGSPNTQKWGIGSGYLSIFSVNSWHVGYGMWSLWFEPRLVQDVVDLAAHPAVQRR